MRTIAIARARTANARRALTDARGDGRRRRATVTRASVERTAVGWTTSRRGRGGGSRDAGGGRGGRAATMRSAASEDADAIEEMESNKSRDLGIVAACLGMSCAFGAAIGATSGSDAASEYFAGYLLEQSLSVDNLFVFVLLFEYFQVPPARQKVVLNYGIFGALIMRAVMIVAGVELIENFKPILLVFAGILIFSSYKLISQGDSDEEEDMADNAVVKFCSKLFDVSDDYDGDNFFTVQNGVKMATPLLLVLAVVEISDVVFAVDSIPAVFGVTKDPFIVYTSNLFAILSLRQLYTLISTAVGELKYLQTAVALVLGFIGSKMVVEYTGVEIPTELSLAVVVTLLSGGVAASLYLPDDSKDEA